jgi:protein TonB
MDLQSNLIESSKLRNGKPKGWKASAAALGVHGLIMSATATHRVAAEDKSIHAFIAHAAAPPPPPPPPPPPAGSSTPKPTPVKPVVIPQTSFVQPRVIPKEVPKVEPVATTETAPPSTNDQPAGEPGGVAGGVPGGVAGGVVGGTVGGVLGGQLGGQLGGVPGGQVGGTGTEPAPAPPPPEKPEGPLRVGGDVKAPIVQHRVDPVYPDMARKTRVAGIVIVEAIINKDGSVEQVKVIKGLPMGMSESAVEAVKQWKFKPGTLNGEPVDVIFNLTVNFKLD